MAKIGTIINKKRNRLEKVIPLQTPYCIYIEPSNLCNFKCDFCAMQSSDKTKNVSKQCMTFEMFKKVVDDIKGFGEKIKMLRLTVNGEPLMNKNLPQMIRYAKESHVADFIEIITNASLLNRKLSNDLIESGIDRIRISIEALDRIGYKKIAKVDIDFERLLENIKYLYDNKRQCEVYVKIVDEAINNKEDEKNFYKLFNDKCDKMFIENIIPIWSDFDELVIKSDTIGLHGEKVKNINVCPYIFYSFIIGSNGDVTCCCADWQRKYVIGNVKEKSVVELWRSDKLKQIWIDMLKGNKNKYEMCKKCLKPMYDCIDNIDKYADEILVKIIKDI